MHKKYFCFLECFILFYVSILFPFEIDLIFDFWSYFGVIMSDELCDFDDKHSWASDSIANYINSDESDYDSDLLLF